MKALSGAGALVARVLLALVFIHAGLGKFSNPARAGGYMAGAGMPGSMIAPLLYLTALIELLGGLLLVAGFQSRAAALLLFLFLIPVTIIFHVVPRQEIEVYKNLAIMGGLLLVVAHGPGRFSFERAQCPARR